jgi:hypothetical protein
MGAMTSGGGVVETIRQQLAAGYSADQVVDGLIAGGLSRPSAERFVLRAGGQVTTVVPPPVPAVALAPPPLPTNAAPAFAAESYAAPAHQSYDAPPPLPAGAMMPPPVPVSYEATGHVSAGHAAAAHYPAPPVTPASAGKPTNVLKVAGGAALLLVGVGLLALSLSSSGRVRLKLPLALVLGGGATLVQAIRER